VPAGVALGGACVVSCLGATQITLHVTTSAMCKDTSQWKGVAIYTGSPTDVETKAATLTTTACGAGGQIGTLVLVPTGSDSDEIGIRVVAGLTRAPEDCAANLYDGCIVARRTLRYSPHKALDMYVALADNCVGVSCDPMHTCVDGTCVDSNSVGTTNGTPPGATVRCGDNGVTCTTSGQVCCLSVDVDAGTTRGVCEDANSCPPTSIVLACDKESDCAGPRDDAGRPNVCCVSYVNGGNGWQPSSIAGTQCLPYPSCVRGYGLELCEDRKACIDGTIVCGAPDTIPPGLMPGYFWCTLGQ
jgi:hypothetical protein